MKFYICKVCKSRGKRLGGTRKEVRKHLKEEHLLRAKRKESSGEYQPSLLTANTISQEFE